MSISTPVCVLSWTAPWRCQYKFVGLILMLPSVFPQLPFCIGIPVVNVKKHCCCSMALRYTRSNGCQSMYPCSNPSITRLLHSGLPAGYETWPLIGWHHPFLTDWSKCRLGYPSVALHSGLMWPKGISIVVKRPLTVSLHSPKGRQKPAFRTVQGDCEKV